MADATTTTVIPIPPPSVIQGLRLAVTHRTTYQYAMPVTHSVNVVRLEPQEFPHQKTLSSFIRVLPATRLRCYTDLFRNTTHQFEIQSAHSRLVIESQLRVLTGQILPTPDHLAGGLDGYLDTELGEMIWPFRQESVRVSFPPEIWRVAVDATYGIESIYYQAAAIMGWIHQEFVYDPEITGVHAHVEESFRLRRGVCQDFTHVMLAMCRAMRLAARYVSGYLYSGKGAMVGAQASHAWCEVCVPGAGWVGFDPTNNTLADERYVKVAVGRDYEDVAPVEGGYHGIAASKMDVFVEIEKIR